MCKVVGVQCHHTAQTGYYASTLRDQRRGKNCRCCKLREGRKSLEGVRLDGAKALVLGTGGASKAVQYVLREGGAEVKVVSRSQGSADLTYEDLTDEFVKGCDIIVNTTPLGMFPNVESAPALPYSALSAKHTLFDCVYNPRQTRFLALGAAQGARTIDGLTMFQAQAEASYQIWSR